jgi:hypothetical protein
LVLKPIFAAACLGVASLAAAQSQAQSQLGPSGLSGQQIGELVAGATVEVETPVGTKLPVSYGRDGRMSGEAGGLAWYLGAATDTGRWWVAADQLCHRWSRWFNAEPRCIWLRRQGRTLHWQSADGGTGTAKITVPAVAEASAAPSLVRPGRMRLAQPPGAEEAGGGAQAPEAKAPEATEVGPQPQLLQQAAAPTAQPPAAQLAAAPLPSLIAPPAAAAPADQPGPRVPAQPATSAWPAQQADAQPHAPAYPRPAQPPARFRVANVRHDDVLNVRSGPSADHDIVGELPPGSRGIAITSECRSRWCPVQLNATAGWVNSAYLAPEVIPAALHAPADTPAGPPRDSPEAPRSCLTPAARGLLNRIEQNFGPVQVVSTCRPGAFIAGTARPSRHASGNAVDFKAGPRKAAILEWLIANHTTGGIMTYAGMEHIHVDIGPRFIALASGRHWSSWRNRSQD